MIIKGGDGTKPSKQVFIWEMVGIGFLIILGTLLHFTYDWASKSTIVGLFSPVNESVWEHLKMGFTALVVFSLIEFWWVRDKTNNFFFAKAVGILSLEACILVIFYGYTFFTKQEILAIDIGSYLIGCAICQIISYKLLVREKMSKTFNVLGLGLIVLLAGLFVFFTFNPPKLPIFQDKNTKSYGIHSSTSD